MLKKIILLLMVLILCSCGTNKKLISANVQVKFLDDFIISEDLEVGGTKVGGLSGIDYHDGTYYLVADHPGNPRFYKARIEIRERKIDSVIISEVIELKRESSDFLKLNTLDLESIRFNPKTEEFIFTSEGSIQNGKDPSVFSTTSSGEYISHYELPAYFKSSGEQSPRNNGVFEGLAPGYDKTGYWVGMELPLKKDGSKPKLFPTKSPIRISFYNKDGEATKQFVMQLEGITKIPWLYFAVNGLTELLEYAPGQFLVLERAFSA
ncbi:esterase-like activity of phytase family protein [Antarcticibacterium sp. 1MA-6-2]|uniref:esterase-like activity of phytase family protein n=1 Tax=Antarcticibacterium sp. 1MA-6-2 TaxID=2908210 RepID=UPI002102252B|nr:esterase-like activity of phytase family protein [Antarcticibacterium sp. 1MA-6-2]